MQQQQYQPTPQYPQQPQYQQPGFHTHAPFSQTQEFQFPQAPQIATDNYYNPVPFIPPVNAAQMIPGYSPQHPSQMPLQQMPSNMTLSPQQIAMGRQTSQGKVHVGESAYREGYGISYNELKFIKKIGAGAFGEVWKGEWAGTDVGIKKILKSDIKESDLDEFASEILLMRFEAKSVFLLRFCSHLFFFVFFLANFVIQILFPSLVLVWNLNFV